LRKEKWPVGSFAGVKPTTYMTTYGGGFTLLNRVKLGTTMKSPPPPLLCHMFYYS